jgi:hypothetical protein
MYRMSTSVVWLPVRLAVAAPALSRTTHETRPLEPGFKETETIYPHENGDHLSLRVRLGGLVCMPPAMPWHRCRKPNVWFSAYCRPGQAIGAGHQHALGVSHEGRTHILKARLV